MMKFAKPLAVLGMVSAVAIAAATPSEARCGRNAAIAAGVAGFAVGAAAGAAVASGPYYGSYGYYGGPAYYDGGYAYSSGPAYGYDSYAYAPRARYYSGDPSSYYAPNYYAYPRSYRMNGPAREDHLTGTGAGFAD
jgi:hypothetical protein